MQRQLLVKEIPHSVITSFFQIRYQWSLKQNWTRLGLVQYRCSYTKLGIRLLADNYSKRRFLHRHIASQRTAILQNCQLHVNITCQKTLKREKLGSSSHSNCGIPMNLIAICAVKHNAMSCQGTDLLLL